jgi:hypothetical protein
MSAGRPDPNPRRGPRISQELFARAEAIRARSKTLESVPGSGYHDDDEDHKGRLFTSQNRPDESRPGKKLPRASEHPVPFYGERTVEVVDPDAEKARAALDAYYEGKKTGDAALFSYTGTERNLLTLIPRA